MDVFEAMGTCRAMRYLKPDPVPDELIDQILFAATRASNPGNSQGWGFVVVRDEGKRKAIQQAIQQGVGALRADTANAGDAAVDPVTARILAGAVHLVENLHLAPVHIVIGARANYPPQNPMMEMLYSTVFTAAQNLVVAARALGLGSVFTTFTMQAQDEIKRILEVPDDVYLSNLIPVGWPERSFGPLARKPLEEVVHYDRWQPGR